MKKILILFTIIILLITTIVTANNFICDKKIEPFDSETCFGVKHPSGVFYNGTRYFVKDITPIYFEDKGEIFFLSMQITIEKYNKSLTIKLSKPESNYTIYPNAPNEKNATYSIMNIPFEPIGNKNDYPYDEYIGNITFWAENDTYGAIFLYYKEKSYFSSQWNLNILGYGNSLYFRFYRVSEINTFETLKFIGLIVLYVNLISIIFFLLKQTIFNKPNNSKKYKGLKKSAYLILSKLTIIGGDTTFYIATLIGIPFYFGVIINNYVLPNHFQNSECIIGIRNLMILLIVLAALIYGFKKSLERNVTK